jgi:hypothetical protein
VRHLLRGTDVQEIEGLKLPRRIRQLCTENAARFRTRAENILFGRLYRLRFRFGLANTDYACRTHSLPPRSLTSRDRDAGSSDVALIQGYFAQHLEIFHHLAGAQHRG